MINAKSKLGSDLFNKPMKMCGIWKEEKQDLEAIDREKAAEDALLEPSPEHDYIILFIHGD